jgi:hypothetical protein
MSGIRSFRTATRMPMIGNQGGFGTITTLQPSDTAWCKNPFVAVIDLHA